MKIAGGLTENDIIVGNTFDKYGSRNPLVQRIMAGFHRTLDTMIARVAPTSVHEVGCGEGYWIIRWSKQGIPARGTDFSEKVIEIARANARKESVDPGVFSARSIYDLESERDSADLIVCCEVLEHLTEPKEALRVLDSVVSNHVVLSVPREPLWRVLNMARGKYLRDFGNTPGHLQHWSKAEFVALIGMRFEVVDVQSPLPWTFVLARRRGATIAGGSAER